jgi:hypothetical protein
MRKFEIGQCIGIRSYTVEDFFQFDLDFGTTFGAFKCLHPVGYAESMEKQLFPKNYLQITSIIVKVELKMIMLQERD